VFSVCSSSASGFRHGLSWLVLTRIFRDGRDSYSIDLPGTGTPTAAPTPAPTTSSALRRYSTLSKYAVASGMIGRVIQGNNVMNWRHQSYGNYCMFHTFCSLGYMVTLIFHRV
jgi:hypothetical protein